ncbi:pseudouridylate synthase, 23S RNA-specific [Vibrio nigripulchritudo ATCC 27043]|uniref:RluA family pseudouridine synthase n=1 Tax=Vibrio nigripulchritudo TaxID=28173 RepID=UPI00021C2DF4|nr:RluA family pseudouridine synthase [Vibrio nigripulchritudo]EGU56239.1 pseudouridylate synthase, 23S RNA-specific [Vibrio nigripulchritudo ATCC 27043]
MSSAVSYFTRFQSSIEGYSLPERFTFPFYYQPHPLCELASQELQAHIQTQTDWEHDFGLGDDPSTGKGKMFGILLVQNELGELGYLSAFSGKVADSNHLPGFVPPVYDWLADDSFVQAEMDEVTKVNAQVDALKVNPDFDVLTESLSELKKQSEVELEKQRQKMIAGRANRKALRAEAENTLKGDELDSLKEELGKQSVAEKNQQKYLKLEWQQRIDEVQQKLDALTAELEALKEKRKALSAALQNKLFDQYRFLNQAGDEKSLLDIFSQTTNPIPPAGSGECAAPKLLHYAFANQLKPVAIAEFWWGVSPKSEVRQHKKYYPACQSKCHPILGHMLEGIEMDENPLLKNPAEGKEIDILYQDEAIVVVNKPSEFLSVPGRFIQDSVYHRLQERFPDVEGPFVIHRLDMSTSGILVFALTKRANKSLQKQFITRHVQKRYVALIEGSPESDNGEIHLPMRGDPDDRPRQLVCYEHGKPAETKWEVLERIGSRTKVRLYPKTGRTHQLRVHCAHQQGLHMPIVGDDLYGIKENRLHLHAEWLAFDHPYSKEPMEFQVDADF